MVHVRVDEKTKERATKTLAAMGMSVSDAVRLDVELFEPEWSERRRVETPAGFEVADHEQDVIDDHPSGRHAVKRSWWPRDEVDLRLRLRRA